MTATVDLEKLSKDLTDEGKLIEAGFIGLRIAGMDVDAPEVQALEMRMAFFAGAAHLFASIMTILDPGEEPTPKDMARLDLIDKELREFIADFELNHVQTKGSA